MRRTVEGALSETTNILQRIRELAVQSSNGTQSTSNRAALDAEAKQLLAQIDGIALDTDHNGIRVLSSSQTVTLQSGAYTSQVLAVAVNGVKTNDLSVNAVSVSTMALTVSAISTIDNAIQSVNTLRSSLGAYQNRLEFTTNTLAIQEENAAASQSAIRDADIAQETMDYTRNQILVGTSVLAQANVLPRATLRLLA